MRIGRFIIGLVAGALVGGAAAAAIGVTLGYVDIRKTEHELRQPHALEPVVTVVRDLPAGHLLTMEDISQRSIPGAVVTSSLVRPSSANYAINQPLAVPLHRGDLLHWSFLVLPPEQLQPHERSLEGACRQALAEEGLISHAVTDPRSLRTLLVEDAR